LAAASSYPPSLLLLTSSSGAGTPKTHRLISGGNELNASNGLGNRTRSTSIGVPDLTGNQLPPGKLRQGKTGATYILSFLNNGAAPSVGTVTLIDTLPLASLLPA